MLIVYHSEMLVRQYSAPIGITLGDGPTLHLDGGQREFQGYSPISLLTPSRNVLQSLTRL
jgi:hypothetical protein